jgi:Protein of unknown function (DUF3810)
MDDLIICIFKGMQRKRFRTFLIPVMLAIGIKIFSFFPSLVERFYAAGFYPVISRFLRILLGWIPFSVGDILYAIALVYLVLSLVRFVSRAFQQSLHRGYLMLLLTKTFTIVLWIYLCFNVLWGLNYDRLPIADRMNLEAGSYSKDELKALMGVIVSKLNTVDSSSRKARIQFNSSNEIFRLSSEAYHYYGKLVPSFYYPNRSVKYSFFGYIANYMGFSGYYNPFTGEAQVNTTIPVFLQPFTTCHEIGHQLGFAKEEEANFSGFLACKSSPDPAFRYSAYLELYLYCGSELFARDSTAYIPYRDSLRPDIRQDLRDVKAFYQKYQNPMEPLIHILYGNYLKANHQPQGINSYDEVVGLAIGYYKKYGESGF